VPFTSRAPEQNGGPNLRRAGHGSGGVIIPLTCQLIAFCGQFSASGALLYWSLEDCIGSERDRHRRLVLICRFGASPVNPAIKAAPNKCLAETNKPLDNARNE
jgi:hypothetical protein